MQLLSASFASLVKMGKNKVLQKQKTAIHF
jgi:hypothetical protein